MAVIRSFGDKSPVIPTSAFVAETAVVVGDVEIGERTSIWYGAVLRGDVFHIRIGADVSIQDNAVVHVTSGQEPAIIGDRVTVGHAVVLHGCTVGDNCIIGMGAVILDRARIGNYCIVGAGALVTPGTDIPDGHLVIGTPARAVRTLSEEERRWIDSSAAHYVELAQRYLAAG